MYEYTRNKKSPFVQDWDIFKFSGLKNVSWDLVSSHGKTLNLMYTQDDDTQEHQVDEDLHHVHLTEWMNTFLMDLGY